MRPVLSLRQPVAVKVPTAPVAPLPKQFAPAQAPWIKPGVVVHEASTLVDALLAKFARAIRDRGFSVSGCVRCGDGDQILDLASDQRIRFDAATEGEAVARRMRYAMRDDADLVVISHFAAMEQAAKGLRPPSTTASQQGHAGADLHLRAEPSRPGWISPARTAPSCPPA